MRVIVKTVLLKLDMELCGWRASLFPSLSNRADSGYWVLADTKPRTKLQPRGHHMSVIRVVS
jgi:hypothetical protein